KSKPKHKPGCVCCRCQWAAELRGDPHPRLYRPPAGAIEGTIALRAARQEFTEVLSYHPRGCSCDICDDAETTIRMRDLLLAIWESKLDYSNELNEDMDDEDDDAVAAGVPEPAIRLSQDTLENRFQRCQLEKGVGHGRA